MFPTGILQGYRKILHIFTGSSFSYISGGLALPFLLTIYHICDLGFPLLIDSSVVSLEIQRTCPLTDVGTSLSVPLMSACPKLFENRLCKHSLIHCYPSNQVQLLL